MNVKRAALSWATLVTLAVCSPAASAEEGDPRARAVAHHQRGIEMFENGDPEAAAQEFEAAQALAPAPSNLFNLALCYEQLGDLARAVSVLEEYVAGDLPEERRARGQEMLERLRATAAGGAAAAEGDAATAEPVAVAVVSEPAGAELFVDGRPQGAEVRTPATLSLAPGNHVIEARLAGHGAARQEVDLPAGQPARVELQLAADAGGADGGEPTPRRMAWTGAIQLNAGAAFALGGEYQEFAGLLGVDLVVGFRLGRPREVRGIETWPLRLEFMGGAGVQPGGDGTLLEVEGGGRLSVAIGQLPIRIEGELALGLTVAWVDAATGDDPQLGMLVVPALALVYQIRRWVEVVFRPARFELLGLAGRYPGGFQMRWGVDAMVRFRI